MDYHYSASPFHLLAAAKYSSIFEEWLYSILYSVHWCFAIFVVNEQNLKQHIQTTLEEGVTKYRRREEMNIEDDNLLKR